MEQKNWKEKAGDAAKRLKTQLGNFFQMCKENKKMFTVIAAFALLVAGIIAVISLSENREVLEAVAEETEAATEFTEEVVEAAPVEALEKDAYPEVNSLIKQYYQALTDGDMEVINSIKNHTDEEEEIKIIKKSEFIESYPSITVYTKKGPEEGTFVAYVQYDVKFYDHETTAPGLNTLYICTDEQGNYYINAGTLEESVVEYLKNVSVQNDVIDLFNTVQVQYNEIKEGDEKLSTFLDELPNRLAESVSLAMAQSEMQEKAEAGENEEAPDNEPHEATIVKTVKTTDVVNVRSSDSIEADKIGQTRKGQVLDLIEEKVNGWSKVDFEGKEGYIKSEFLEPEETEQVMVSENGDVLGAAVETWEEGITHMGKVTDTVNVRETPSTDATIKGILTKGSKIEVIQQQANGWTKIQYNTIEAYVKSDFVKLD